MNERLTEIYRSCRPKEALASQDQFKSANVLIGSEIDKFVELIVEECIFAIDEQCSNSDAEGTIEAITILQKHFRS
jgi:hypothetical protein